MFGVCISEPKHPMSLKPRSSARIRMMFGRLDGVAEVEFVLSLFLFAILLIVVGRLVGV